VESETNGRYTDRAKTLLGSLHCDVNDGLELKTNASTFPLLHPAIM